MATSSPNENAPAEAATYNFANLDAFTLSPGESLDTDDAALVAAVSEHPWLDVEGTVAPDAFDEAPSEDENPDEVDDFDNRGFFAAGDND